MTLVRDISAQCVLLGILVLQELTLSPSIASEDLRDDPARLASEFSMVALDRRFGKAYDKVVKWTGPIRYAIHGNHVTGVVRDIIQRRMDSLKQLTKLDIMGAKGAKDNVRENFSVFYLIASERNELVSNTVADARRAAAIRDWNDSRADCAYRVSIEDGVITKAEVYVKAEIMAPTLLQCAETLLSRSMGIFNVADIPDSIFGSKSGGSFMTDKDKVFLRILYLEDLHANTPIDLATRLVKKYVETSAVDRRAP